MDGLDAGKLLGLICDRTNLSRDHIGKMDLKGAYSFFEVDKNQTEIVKKNLHGFEYKGRMVRIEVTEGRNEREGRSERPERKRSSGGGSFQRRKDDQRSKGGRDRERRRY